MTPTEFMESINPEPLSKNSLSFKELSELAIWLNDEIERVKNIKNNGGIDESNN